MIKIIFVCFGNICRSPMAEFIMKDLVEKAGLSDKIIVESAGCYPAVGTPMADGTSEQLKIHHIPFTKRTSKKLNESDYDIYDYIVGMDKENVDDIIHIVGGDKNNKVYLLLNFAGENRSVADPWYTDDYVTTYADIFKGCSALLNSIDKQKL